jgi:SH3 domain-containing YSC84-like protein 1
MKLLTGVLVAALAAVPMFAQKDASSRLAAATQDLHDMMNADDKGIPQDLIAKATCVVVVPNLKSGGFIVGGQYGKGFFTCRKESGVGWSAPGSLRLSGGKFGLLIGGKETDVIMLVMNKEGMSHLLSNKFQIGGEAAAAAGPVGRDSSAMTDAAMRAQILTYSRSRGIFGGLDIGGSAVTEDDDSNKELYGSNISNKEIFNGSPKVPEAAKPFLHELDRISSRK